MDLPGHNKTLAPGMSQVIEAGEHYTLTDDKGAELELIGKLDAPTLAFIRAFDVWLALELRTGPTSEMTAKARAAMIEKWNALGDHVKREIVHL